MKVKRTRTPERPCEPGSIEQELDMCESGLLRGDEIIRHQQRAERNPKYEDEPPMPDEDGMLHNYHEDMSEPNREGDEMSGDEHSYGLQGGEPELEEQDNVDSGLPGEETEKQEVRERKSAA